MVFMESKTPPEIECWSLLVCAYVHLFLRKDPNGSGRHKHFRTSGLKREEKQGRQKHLVQRCPALQIEQAAPDCIMLQRLPEEIGVFPRTETSSLG